MRWDDIHDAREAFLACMRATCAPGVPVLIGGASVSDDPRLDRAAAILLALTDDRVSVASVGDAGRAVARAVTRGTGARPADIADADFVLVGGDATAGTVAQARQGTRREPHRASTVVYAGAWPAVDVALAGPGVETPRVSRVAMPRDDVVALAEPLRRAPCGVDVFVLTADGVVAIPRSSTVTVQAG